MRNEMRLFESKEFGNIRTIEIDGKPYFVANDLAKVLGYKNIVDAINRHCRWVVKHDIPHPQSKTKTLEVNVIPEGDMYRLISNSELPNAEKFESWVFDEVLPQLRKTGTYSLGKNVTISFKEQVECIGVVADMLRVNDASKIMMIGQLYKSYDLPTEFLPKYEYNGSKELKSATDLLKRFDLGMSARNFNVLLRGQGYLEERTRKSSSSTTGTKKYNALTEKGLKYGENAVSPQCQREVQPMYYADTFKELFNLVMNVEVA